MEARPTNFEKILKMPFWGQKWYFFQEKTFVILSASYIVYGQDGESDEVTHEFFKTKIDLAFEPASFTIMKTYSQYGSDGGAGSGYEKIYEQGQFDVSTRYF